MGEEVYDFVHESWQKDGAPLAWNLHRTKIPRLRNLRLALECFRLDRSGKIKISARTNLESEGFEVFKRLKELAANLSLPPPESESGIQTRSVFAYPVSFDRPAFSEDDYFQISKSIKGFLENEIAFVSFAQDAKTILKATARQVTLDRNGKILSNEGIADAI